jgi:hypothetical protein
VKSTVDEIKCENLVDSDIKVARPTRIRADKSSMNVRNRLDFIVGMLRISAKIPRKKKRLFTW